MTMTRSENQWIDRVMHTISYLAFIDSSSAVAGTLEQHATEEVVRAAQSFIEKLKRENAVAAEKQNVPGLQ